MFWLMMPVAASLVPVVCLPGGLCAWIIQGGRWHIYGRHRGRSGRRRISAAGSLASESKLQGEIDICDYSYYQLFRCSFWVCFYIAVCRLKY